MVASEKIIKIKLVIQNIGMTGDERSHIVDDTFPKGWLIALTDFPDISAWDTDNHHFHTGTKFCKQNELAFL